MCDPLPRWYVLPDTSLATISHTMATFGGDSSLVALSQVLSEALACTTVPLRGGSRVGVMKAVEAAFSVALEDRPAPRHLDRLRAIGFDLELVGQLRADIRARLEAGLGVVAPATPKAILSLMRGGVRFAVAECPSGPMASEERAYARQPWGEGVIGSWWGGAWTLADLAAATQTRAARGTRQAS